ncbi:MAG: ATP-dependent dethiobiotin synthetase BioD [Candidatus Manganitrophus sp.]|nr:ATP-dependent dethiobiotin synthetase BioD [Candidatus Manganitrophus sp.]
MIGFADSHSFLIVEGVGGLMVPLTAHADVSDLIRLFDLPVLLVARSGLGTLNHTLLTLHHGARLGIRFLGVLFNRTVPSISLADKTNPATLAERTDVPLLGTLSYFKKSGKSGERYSSVRKIIDGKDELMKSAILRWINGSNVTRVSECGRSYVGLLE